MKSIAAAAGVAAVVLAMAAPLSIGGYFIEGHVPAADIQSLLPERPEALGLDVSGIPIRSPRLEQGEQREAFETLLIRRDGRSEGFARQNEPPSGNAPPGSAAAERRRGYA